MRPGFQEGLLARIITRTGSGSWTSRSNTIGGRRWLIEGVSSVDDSSELTGPSRVVIDF